MGVISQKLKLNKIPSCKDPLLFNKYGISHIATYDVIADKGVGADQINFYKGDRAAFDKLSADADYKAVAKEAEAFRDARGYTSATLRHKTLSVID